MVGTLGSERVLGTVGPLYKGVSEEGPGLREGTCRKRALG